MLAWAILSFLAAASAQSVQTTASIFLPQAYEPNVKFAASVINACSDATTYNVRCTRGVFASKTTCNANGPTFKVTEGKNTYAASTTTRFTSALMTLSETCVLRGMTHASCAGTVTLSSNYKTSSYTSTGVLRGPTVSQYYFYKVEITGGAEKLSSTATCTSGSVRSISVLALGSIIGAFVFAVVFVL